MKISIVTPSFNQGEFIRDTLESVANQKGNFELQYILVDAESTDETDKIVSEFSPVFKKQGIDFVYIREPDKGQSDAINKGLARSSGDVVSYINSDDFYEPDVLGRIADYFDSNPEQKWAYGGWKFVNKEGVPYRTVQPKIFRKGKLLDYCNIGQPSCFFRKSLIEEFGSFNQNRHLTMDYDLWLRFATKYSPGIMPFIVANMRYHENAKSGSRAMEHLKETFDLCKQYSETFSIQRIRQIFYYLRGIILIFLRFDITRRIQRASRK